MGREVSVFIIITTGKHAGSVLVYHHLSVNQFRPGVRDFIQQVKIWRGESKTSGLHGIDSVCLCFYAHAINTDLKIAQQGKIMLI